ncbi:MAG: DUF262 domain-containing protein [Deltaproteobacteria bacterium]|nr:DUF262 domain-containing protein [Deltaproteobacteria bacterium]
MFNPQTEYDVFPDKQEVRDFFLYPEKYVDRPPYQRKSVWSGQKKQDLMESLFRHYYIPKLVLREVRVGDNQSLWEVVDGQQRINTVQDFFGNKFKLPKSLDSLDSRLSGKKYGELTPDLREFADKQLKYDIDIIKGIFDPQSPKHQKIATEIFWRLQQGEPLNKMEIAHARLSSPIRNFLAKYADDISFDYPSYKPFDSNPSQHVFFNLLDQRNERMQFLSLLGKLLLIEKNGGACDMGDQVLCDWIDETQHPGGISDESYENEPTAKGVLKCLNLFHEIFKDDPIIDDKNGIKEFKREYFYISLYMLLRHLQKTYAMDDELKATYKQFVYDFHGRWNEGKDDDHDIQLFKNNRQQNERAVETREHVVRKVFFEYLADKGVELKTLDSKRAFSEMEKIKLYRAQNGLCQICLAEGKTEKQARVPWKDYQADHIMPWVRGGQTSMDNAQVLCSLHNAQKSDRT